MLDDVGLRVEFAGGGGGYSVEIDSRFTRVLTKYRVESRVTETGVSLESKLK